MRTRLLALCTTLAAGTLVGAGAAGAAPPDYRSQPLGEVAPGLAVSGVLSDLRLFSRVRVVVPARWVQRDAPPGQLRFTVRQNSSCSFELTYRVASVVVPRDATAAARLDAVLPPAAPRYVLDAGTHGATAYRVVRQPSTGGRIRLEGAWAGVLTLRADVVPAGSAAWTQVRVSARSHVGDECHSGTYRNVGPLVGDSLAVARTAKSFRRT